MSAPGSTLAAYLADFVVACDECGGRVSMFTLNDEGRAACVPCGHPAHVTFVPRREINDDEAA